MKVYIKIFNLNGMDYIEADEETSQLTYNFQQIKCNVKRFVGEITKVIFNWDDKYINNSILDGEEFRIKLVADNGKEKVIVGKNQFPSNYSEFKRIINEVKRNGN